MNNLEALALMHRVCELAPLTGADRDKVRQATMQLNSVLIGIEKAKAEAAKAADQVIAAAPPAPVEPKNVEHG